jgi:hypothetical protein
MVQNHDQNQSAFGKINRDNPIATALGVAFPGGARRISSGSTSR